MGEKDKAVSGDCQCSRTSSADTDHTVDDPYQLCKRCHRHDPGYELESTGRYRSNMGRKRVAFRGAASDRSYPDPVQKANGAVQFLNRDGKKLLAENPSEPRLLLDSQTWNVFCLG